MPKFRMRGGKLEQLLQADEDALTVYEANRAQWEMDNAAAMAAMRNAPTADEQINALMEWVDQNSASLPALTPGLFDVLSRFKAARDAVITQEPTRPSEARKPVTP